MTDNLLKQTERTRGRKTLFRDHMIEESQKLAELGFTNEEIADFWGRSRRSLQRWLKKYPEFSHTLKAAKSKADKRIEESLYKRAQGYEYTEKTYEKRGGKMVLMKEVTKEVAASTTAQIFWLKNRRPDLWRDTQGIEHSGSIKATLSMADLKKSISDYDNRNDK